LQDEFLKKHAWSTSDSSNNSGHTTDEDINLNQFQDNSRNETILQSNSSSDNSDWGDYEDSDLGRNL
jgi:hypothetical protein